MRGIQLRRWGVVYVLFASAIVLAGLLFSAQPAAAQANEPGGTTIATTLYCTPDTETPSGWAPLVVSSVAVTNQPIRWQWDTPVALDEAATFEQYGYALYGDGQLVEEGRLASTATQFIYTPTSDAVYQLIIWMVVSDSEDPSTHYNENCATSVTHYDTQAPVIMADGYDLLEAVATLNFVTDETDLVYTWETDALPDEAMLMAAGATGKLEMSQAGTYRVTLTATDQAGNSAVVHWDVTYPAPTPPPDVVAPVDPKPKPKPAKPAVSVTKKKPAARAAVASKKPVVRYAAVARTVSVTTPAPEATEGSILEEAASSAAANTAQATSTLDAPITKTERDAQSDVAWYWWVLLVVAVVGTTALWYWRGDAYRHRADDT